MIEMKIKRFEPLEYQVKEAINTLCTNLSFAGGDIRKIMVTSCKPQEGKSFVTMNLMRSMARLGMKVVLVDADIRASALQATYDIRIEMPEEEKYSGLTKYLVGRCDMEDILAKTNIPGAWMILSGKNVVNSLPLFNTPRFGQLLDELAKRFDLVLVDVPPVGTIIDAARIASCCDGTVFVVQSGSVSRQELLEAIQQVEKAGCPILGCVLNRCDDRRSNQTYYYQRRSYSSDEKRGTRKQQKKRAEKKSAVSRTAKSNNAAAGTEGAAGSESEQA